MRVREGVWCVRERMRYMNVLEGDTHSRKCVCVCVCERERDVHRD